VLRSLLLAIALLLPATALADGDEVASAKSDEGATKPPTPAEQLHQLRGERTEILEELTALEEGYSELVDADAGSLEIRVQGLLDRLTAVDRRITLLSSK